MAIQSLSKPAASKASNAGNWQRWEYFTMSYNFSYGATTYQVNGEKDVKLKNQKLNEVLTQFGQLGWELTGISEGTYVFKRESAPNAKSDSSAK